MTCFQKTIKRNTSREERDNLLPDVNHDEHNEGRAG
jgi:hypothetical protein